MTTAVVFKIAGGDDAAIYQMACGDNKRFNSLPKKYDIAEAFLTEPKCDPIDVAHAAAELWLARRGGRPVSSLAAQRLATASGSDGRELVTAYSAPEYGSERAEWCTKILGRESGGSDRDLEVAVVQFVNQIHASYKNAIGVYESRYGVARRSQAKRMIRRVEDLGTIVNMVRMAYHNELISNVFHDISGHRDHVERR